MSFKNLERFEAKRKAEFEAAKKEREETEARRALRRAVQSVIPKSVRAPKRPRGRSPSGGVSRKEVAALRAQATKFLDGDTGLQALEAQVQHTALVILMIDGVLGTEPWRAAQNAHGGLIAANARLRYLENAARLLDDLRRSRDGGRPKLLEGVIEDAEITPGKEEENK